MPQNDSYTLAGRTRFTVTGLSGYALTGAAVPEPGTLGLSAAGLLGLYVYARQKRKHP
jgi:hypothetical protein